MCVCVCVHVCVRVCVCVCVCVRIRVGSHPFQNGLHSVGCTEPEPEPEPKHLIKNPGSRVICINVIMDTQADSVTQILIQQYIECSEKTTWKNNQ